MSTKRNTGLQKPGGQQLDSAVLEKFLENQSKELDVRTQEINLQQTTEKQSFEYSKLALDKQAVDRQHHREFVRKCRKDSFFFISGVIAVIGLVIGYSLWLGKDAIAMEIIKAIIFLLSGGAGGYALGKNNTKKNDDD